MARMVRDLHERGAYLLDLSTQNLMTDEVDGLKVIDWEFLQDFGGDRPPVHRSPSVLGRADGAARADGPVGLAGGSSGGRVTLFRPLYTGVPRALLVHLPGRVVPVLAEPGMVLLYVARLLRGAVLLAGTRARRGVKMSVKAALTLLFARPD
jgi:hypothetical protein